MPAHPYFVGVQFHPEFKSRPGKPSALFLGMFFYLLLLILVMILVIIMIVSREVLLGANKCRFHLKLFEPLGLGLRFLFLWLVPLYGYVGAYTLNLSFNMFLYGKLSG